MKNTIRIFLFIISFCFLGYSIFMIAEKVYAYYHDNKQYEQLRTQVVINNSSDNPVSEVTTIKDAPRDSTGEISIPYTIVYDNSENLDVNGVLKEYSALFNQNKDLTGWIRIPGFKKIIDYPVMQADNNEFYLKRDFYKNSSLAGSLYMDFRNKDQDDKNIIIYGHAMKDYSMFGNLKDFSKHPDKYTKVTKIYFDLMNTHMEYEIFSAYNEKASYNYRQISFTSDNEYMSFLQTISDKSVYKYNIKLTSKDKILTLSTCSDLSKDIRSIIQARLVKQIVYTGSVKKPTEVGENGQQEGKNIITANIYLHSLSVDYYRNNKYENTILTPSFNNNVKEYEVSIPYDADKISFLFETEDPKAKTFLTLNGTEVEPASIKLENGSNIIKIKVVSQDSQYSRTYTINAIKLPATSNTKKKLPPEVCLIEGA